MFPQQDRWKVYIIKKSNTLPDAPNSLDVKVNEVIEAITTMDDKQTDTMESVYKSADEEDLYSLFDQYSYLMLPTSDWLPTGIVIAINEASSRWN